MKLGLYSHNAPARTVTEAFYGIENALRTQSGCFAAMENFSSDAYPLLATRRGRSTLATLTAPRALAGKAALAWIDGSSLYYAGANVTSYLSAAGVSIGATTPKKLVGMGSYLLIFPDKIYFNTADYSDCGSMEASVTTGTTVTYSPSLADGTVLSGVTVSAAAPSEPSNGDYWIDTGSAPHVLRRYSAASAIWTEEQTAFTRIGCTGIGTPFAVDDAVTLSGCAVSASAAEEQIAALNGTRVIYSKDADFLVVSGILDCICTQATAVTVSRTVPAMDFVVQAQNRLWGCRYGLVNGAAVNEIYASALGDFKNFHRYTGLSGDSYAASVGSDGAFTGAGVQLGQPVFFKENCLHKVYVSAYGAHQIVETACIGVAPGCGGSVAQVGGALYYKAKSGVMRYDGALPTQVGDALGELGFVSAVGGAWGDKYLLCTADGAGGHDLFAYDTRRGVWCREDGLNVLAFAEAAGEGYALAADGRVLSLSGSGGTAEGAFEWSLESGILGCAADKKYLSRVVVRLKLAAGAFAELKVEYDGSGEWRSAGSTVGTGAAGVMDIAVRPCRCDHFRLRLEGTGGVTLVSLTEETTAAQ